MKKFLEFGTPERTAYTKKVTPGEISNGKFQKADHIKKKDFDERVMSTPQKVTQMQHYWNDLSHMASDNEKKKKMKMKFGITNIKLDPRKRGKITSFDEEVDAHAKVMAKKGDSAKTIKKMHPEITDDELESIMGKKEESDYKSTKKAIKYRFEEDRNYRKEYDNYHAQPEQRERNAARLRARRQMVKAGKVEKFDKKDVHHKDNNPLNNEEDNLAVTTQTWNRTEPRLRKEEVKIKESIKLSDQGLVRPYFNGKFKDMKLAFSTHSKTDHLDREGTFNSAKLIGTFKKFHKKYKNKISEIPRIPEDDLANDEDRHYIYDKEFNYSILFFIKAGTPKDTFIVMTAYPNRPKIVGSMTKWEV